MRLPRMTTRRWMVAVLLAGSMLGLHAALERRRARFDRLAVEHNMRSAGLRARVRAGGNSSVKQAATENYHFRMAEKYRHAARCPWLPVEPGPPEP
jgi:hypothetical protein